MRKEVKSLIQKVGTSKCVIEDTFAAIAIKPFCVILAKSGTAAKMPPLSTLWQCKPQELPKQISEKLKQNELFEEGYTIF